ncbi:GNAT family N-acetyltransferase [Agromyces sp. SYSU K20354]|uniref:GNAT family N-acetyltransferase n=1 Tax=Agromyces cavernae TaxID=2898659 RepID=UPI001E53D942|nr:GNAT family N-acetyltransferase [Agromyces cavernae]MCD2442945.1 GNAT family N-acetyltransferase [Agromyces cavernae]
MSFDLRGIPLDATAARTLAAKGLEYRLVDTSDVAAATAWIAADFRGFHHARPRQVSVDYDLAVIAERRVQGVYDPTISDPAIPVATVSSWPTGLSVPGGRSVDAWAVSSVTVSPTHRRRGIARALMLAELENARAAGAALAVLTATEATIYGRFGYAPAARAATVHVDRRRTHWIGPDAPGRVQFVEAEDLRRIAPALARRAVARTPGEIDRWPGILDRALGLVDPEGEHSRRKRVVRYDDEQGNPQGFAVFQVVREPNEHGVVEFDFLAAATDDAERALWRFLVEQDFVTSVRGLLRSVDEPLPWLLEDPRAMTVSDVVDHLWVRVLDPVAALGSRRYGTAGTLGIDVTDPQGHAAGRFELVVDERGRAEVQRADGAGAGAGGSTASSTPGIRLGVHELGAIFLGGVRPSVLARAGRLTLSAPRTAELADRMFLGPRTPHLSIWF